jgi:RNA polymerase sigma factor (sigma-70 family)
VRLGPALRAWTESGDLVQETCLAVLRDLPHTEVTTEFELLDWLAGIATNRVRELSDYLHAQKREVARQHPLEVDHPLAAASRSSPSEYASRAEVRAILDEVLSELSADYREVVLLRDYLGASWPEIARALATPSVHAAQQLHQRAWLKLRRQAAPRLVGLEPD